ncbi:MAG: ATP-binding protein [Comamonadaceae bacterium]
MTSKTAPMEKEEFRSCVAALEERVEERTIQLQKVLNMLRKRVSSSLDIRMILQNLKSNSTGGNACWKQEDLHQILDLSLNRVRAELKCQPKVFRHYGELPPVCCQSAQLLEVFMTLLVNAVQSLEAKRELSILTDRLGDDKVRIRIIDTGRGMAPDHVARIFDPVLSQDPLGKGSGLGLWLAARSVERHHGEIEVWSQVGSGTRFTITLPIGQPDAHGA